MNPRHLFHAIQVPSQALALAAYSADKEDAPVYDLRDYGPGAKIGFLVIATAQTTLDANNYFDAQIWEADDKTSSTALDATARVVSAVNSDGHDALGLTEDGTLLDSDTMATFPFPRFNAAAQVGKVYWFTYRGYKPCVQLRLYTGGSGDAPDATLMALAVVTNGDTQNIKASIVN